MQKDFSQLLKNYEPKPLGETHSYAVLLPLVWDELHQEWQVLYQVRSEMISQPGEVSFPGGSSEGNESLQETAIRETMEELNVRSEQIRVFGEIDYLVYSYRTIHCFIGQLLLDDWRKLKPNEEVARLFAVPLNALLQQPPKYYRLSTKVLTTNDFPFERIRNGADYKFSHHDRKIPFYDVTNENIGGMTAQFTHRFTDIVKELGLLDR